MSSCTVIITCFNDGEFIKEAIESVENSTFKSEIIIVDDCSTDAKTIAAVKELSNKYNVIQIQKNAGVGNARNTAIRQAQTEFILPLDADDKIAPDFIKKAIDFLNQNPEYVLVYGNQQRFGEDDKLVSPPLFDGSMLLSGNYINNSSLYRKVAWDCTSGYDTTLPNYEDWDMWIQLYSNGGTFKKLEELALFYRIKKVSKVGKTKDPLHREKVVNYICEKHIDLYKNNVARITGFLHRVVTANEQQLAMISEGSGSEELANKIVNLEQQLKDQKAYYEGSVFWKLKKLLQFKK